MTNRQWAAAWTEIAVAYETEPERRTIRQSRIACRGLCRAALAAMRRRLWNKLDRFGRQEPAYWFPTTGWPGWTREHDFLRATFAALFAAMTIKEFEEVCR